VGQRPATELEKRQEKSAKSKAAGEFREAVFPRIKGTLPAAAYRCGGWERFPSHTSKLNRYSARTSIGWGHFCPAFCDGEHSGR